MRRVIFLPLLLYILGCMDAEAQAHAYPDEQEKGISGPELHSFVLGWLPDPAAIGYEYVLSDNRLCFAGCSGDTRQAYTSDTFAIEYGLTVGRPYFWITRIHFANGDTSEWSSISSFQAENDSLRPLISIVPQPASTEKIDLWIDWAAFKDLGEVTLTLFDMGGRQIGTAQTFLGSLSARRIQEVSLTQSGLRPGRYFLFVEPLTLDGFSLQPQWKKIQVR